MRVFVASLALVIVAGLSGVANAQVTINFQENGTGDLGTTGPSGNGTFTDKLNDVTVTATAYYEQYDHVNHAWTWNQGAPNGQSNDLFAKSTTNDISETGLGLTSDTVNQEITYGHGILLTFSNLDTSKSITFNFGSLQLHGGKPSDQGAVYNFNGGIGSLVGTASPGDVQTSGPSKGLALVTTTPGASTESFLITELNQPWCDNPNVLLASVIFTPESGGVHTTSVPEPSTLAIGTVGALAFLGYGVRRRRLKA